MLAAAIEVGGIAFVFPAIQSLISRRTDPAEQGGILGAGESVSSIARITGIMLGVWLYAVWPGAPFWSAAVMMAIVPIGSATASPLLLRVGITPDTLGVAAISAFGFSTILCAVMLVAPVLASRKSRHRNRL